MVVKVISDKTPTNQEIVNANDCCCMNWCDHDDKNNEKQNRFVLDIFSWQTKCNKMQINNENNRSKTV